jgi:hypothetical protein
MKEAEINILNLHAFWEYHGVHAQFRRRLFINLPILRDGECQLPLADVPLQVTRVHDDFALLPLLSVGRRWI